MNRNEVLKMEKYIVMKPGYVNQDGSITDPVPVKPFNEEAPAVKLLRTFNPDHEYFIERQVREHVAERIYEWYPDESYGLHGKKWISDFDY